MHQASVGYHCPQCVRAHRRSTQPRRSNSNAPGGSPITVCLVAACVAVFFLDGMQSDSTVTFDYALDAQQIRQHGEWYRVLTSSFVHANLLHLGFNMWLLWALGQGLETRFGSLTFSAVYVVGALGGSAGALLLEPTTRVVGASGAVFALMGIIFVLQRLGGVAVFSSGIGGLVAINIALSFRDGISLGGHLGGLAAGLVAGVLLDWARKHGARSAAVANLAIAACGLALMFITIFAVDRAFRIGLS